MAGQINYSTSMTAAMAGMLYDMRNVTIESYACESAAIPFGTAVTPGTDPRKQVKAPTGAGQGFRGIALMEFAHEQNPATGVASYQQYEVVNVLRKGAVWVQTNGTVAENGVAFYIAASGLFGSAGEVTSSGGSRAGVYRTATTGSGLAVVEIDL